MFSVKMDRISKNCWQRAIETTHKYDQNEPKMAVSLHLFKHRLLRLFFGGSTHEMMRCETGFGACMIKSSKRKVATHGRFKPKMADLLPSFRDWSLRLFCGSGHNINGSKVACCSTKLEADFFFFKLHSKFHNSCFKPK